MLLLPVQPTRFLPSCPLWMLVRSCLKNQNRPTVLSAILPSMEAPATPGQVHLLARRDQNHGIAMLASETQHSGPRLPGPSVEEPLLPPDQCLPSPMDHTGSAPGKCLQWGFTRTDSEWTVSAPARRAECRGMLAMCTPGRRPACIPKAETERQRLDQAAAIFPSPLTSVLYPQFTGEKTQPTAELGDEAAPSRQAWDVLRNTGLARQGDKLWKSWTLPLAIGLDKSRHCLSSAIFVQYVIHGSQEQVLPWECVNPTRSTQPGCAAQVSPLPRPLSRRTRMQRPREQVHTAWLLRAVPAPHRCPLPCSLGSTAVATGARQRRSRKQVAPSRWGLRLPPRLLFCPSTLGVPPTNPQEYILAFTPREGLCSFPPEHRRILFCGQTSQ